jgi:DNA invertase Pin-like site-specific DNA recombinase
MRVALYARYSSENQKDSSIEQQFRLLQDRAAAEGWEVVGRYEDKALSGSNRSALACSSFFRRRSRSNSTFSYRSRSIG